MPIQLKDIKQQWIDYLNSCQNRVDKEKATKQVEWLYEASGFLKPFVIFLDSPEDCYYGALLFEYIMYNTIRIKNKYIYNGNRVRHQASFIFRIQTIDGEYCLESELTEKYLYDKSITSINKQDLTDFEDKIGAAIYGEKIMFEAIRDIDKYCEPQFKDDFMNDKPIHDLIIQNHLDTGFNSLPSAPPNKIFYQMQLQLGDKIGFDIFEIWKQIERHFFKEPELYSHSDIGFQNLTSRYGMAYRCDFLEQIGVLKSESFVEYKNLLLSGIYGILPLKECCFVSDMPIKISRNSKKQLHCENAPALEFRGGLSYYYWNGVLVPGFWIMDKSRITEENIINERNVEKRRCLREILGIDRYFNLLGGVSQVDSDVDDYGNEMTLYRSNKKDNIIDDYIQFLTVVCPSTKRKYILYPPNQKSKNVWEAKASTFNNQKIQIRHGDVGLLNLKMRCDRPEFES